MNQLFLMGGEPGIVDAPLTYLILLITVYTSYRYMEYDSGKANLMFIPYEMQREKQWYRFFSHGLIHNDWIHLLFNGYVLVMFGGMVEMSLKSPYLFGALGNMVYLGLYISGLVMSSLYSYYKHKDNRGYAALGASGAVSSVVFAFILLAPTSSMGLIFIPGVYFPAVFFGLAYLAYSVYMSKRNMDNVGHDAHYWGSIWGFVFLAALKPMLLYSFFAQIKAYIMGGF
ncbi:MAG: rhomboid family intramembrane serine protease [Aureispira sp.]